MGYRGTVNTLNFGEGRFRPRAARVRSATLIGEPEPWARLHVPMMNEVYRRRPPGAAALSYTGYLEALDYARNRPQGRPISAKDDHAAGTAGRARGRATHAARAEAYAEGGLAFGLYRASSTSN